MSVINLGDAVFFTIISIVFACGGFYLLTNWRIKRLEDSQKEQGDNITDIRDRTMRIETIMETLKKSLNI